MIQMNTGWNSSRAHSATGPSAALGRGEKLVREGDNCRLHITGSKPVSEPVFLIGLRAMEILRGQPPERLHSRKLRSFAETAFQ